MVLLVLLLAAFLRLYNLADVPPSLSLDEVSLGYNAYSILRTGVDEYGTKLPLSLRAYDDWRPALYAYFIIPSIKIFGLNAWAVRLPSIILSLITVYFTYLIVLELFKQRKIALIAMLFLAISPWHIYISRLSHEANLGLSLVVLGGYYFLRFINTNLGNYLFFSTIIFSLSLYAYQSEKVVVPVMFGMFWLFNIAALLKVKRWVLLSTLIGLILTLPVINMTFSSEGLIRLRGTSAFSVDQSEFYQAAQRLLIARQAGDIIGIITNHRYFLMTKIFISNFIAHFNPQWLFNGGNFESHKVPGVGLLYIWELPLIFLGIIKLSFLKKERIKMILLLTWLFSAIIPAAITTQAPHAMRAYTSLPIWQIFSALGFVTFTDKFKKSFVITKISKLFFLLIFIGSIGYFFGQYFYKFPLLQSRSFQYALKSAIPYVQKHQDKYQKIIFSNTDSLYQSYMFFLFYMKYDPTVYLQQGGTKSGGYAETHTFSKYEFRPIDWKNEAANNGANLYIGNLADFPDDIEVLFTSNYLDKQPGIKIVKK